MVLCSLSLPLTKLIYKSRHNHKEKKKQETRHNICIFEGEYQCLGSTLGLVVYIYAVKASMCTLYKYIRRNILFNYKINSRKLCFSNFNNSYICHICLKYQTEYMFLKSILCGRFKSCWFF